MKKVLFPILALVLALGLSLPMAAHTEGSPQVQTLYAGQDIDVGTVSVWNDADNLYVKYETTGGWKMTETHLHVAGTLAGIPQTRKNNPIPGKFDHQMQHALVNQYTYTIPLGDWVPCNTVSIAAQAEVWDTSSTATMQVFSNVGDTVYGPIYSSAPVGDAAWGSPGSAVRARNYLGYPSNPITGTTVDSKTWSWGEGWNPTYNPDITSVIWISTARDTENWWQDSWRWFTESFTVPGIPVSGAVTVNADNEYTAYANGVPIGSDTNIWDSLLTHPFTPVMGMNTLDFVTRNIAQGSQGNLEDQVRNPNGLTYLAEVEYYDREETAWGDGTRFVQRGNWAMYFEYHVQGPSVETGNLLGENGEGGVRYKSFGNTGSREIYVGIPDLGDGANRVETDFTWTSPGTHTVSFAYDETNDKLVGTVDGTTLEWTNISSTADPSTWDTMLIIIANRDTGTTVNLNDVELNGYWSLGDFSGGVGPSGWHFWSVSWDEFDESWTLTGEIELAGTFSFPGGSELSKVEIQVGPAA